MNCTAVSQRPLVIIISLLLSKKRDLKTDRKDAVPPVMETGE